MAFLHRTGDPRGEPKISFDGQEWVVHHPYGSRPERQRQANQLVEMFNRNLRVRKRRNSFGEI